MNETLQNELRKLLEQYPELENSTISFSQNVVSVIPKETGQNNDQGTGNTDIPLCQLTSPCPDVIRGHSFKVEVRKSPVHGYGVFAKEPIESGELIEEHRMLRLGLRKKYIHDEVLNDILFGNQLCTCKECTTHGFVVSLALGLGSLYNHSDNPNTSVTMGFKKGMKTISANRRIEKDEEIFISYGKKYFLIRDFWKAIEKNNALEKHLESARKAH